MSFFFNKINGSCHVWHICENQLKLRRARQYSINFHKVLTLFCTVQTDGSTLVELASIISNKKLQWSCYFRIKKNISPGLWGIDRLTIWLWLTHFTVYLFIYWLNTKKIWDIKWWYWRTVTSSVLFENPISLNKTHKC